MTATVSPARRFTTMVGYVPRACLPARRMGVLAIPVVAAVLFGLLTHAIDEPRDEAVAAVAAQGLFGLVLPLGALVIGDAVLGAELRNGALPFTWLSPVRIIEIVLARWLGGLLVALATLLPACLAAAAIAGAPEAVGGLTAAIIPMLAAHLALFVLIGATTRRAAVWSLVVVLLGERLLGAALTGVAGLSPTWIGRSVYTSIAPGTDDWVRDGIPEGPEAIVRLVIVTVVCLALAGWRLARVRLTGVRD